MIDPPELTLLDAQPVAVIAVTATRRGDARRLRRRRRRTARSDGGAGGGGDGRAIRPPPAPAKRDVRVRSRLPRRDRDRAGRTRRRQHAAGGRVARTTYRGDYAGLPGAWGDFTAWLRMHNIATGPTLWEVYTAGPGEGPDPATWSTELVRPLA